MSTPIPDEVRIVRANVELRDTDAVGAGPPYRYIEGRAVPFGVWADVGPYLEQHVVGSFERSTKGGSGRSLPLLPWHDNNTWPLGTIESWRNDEDGLWGTWRLNDTEEAQQAAKMARSGGLGGLSIGFQPIRSEPQILEWEDWNPELGWDHMDRITRLESRLLEVSLTPTPAFEDSRVTCVREAPTRAGTRSETDMVATDVVCVRTAYRREPKRDSLAEVTDYRARFDLARARQRQLDATLR